MFWVFLPVNVRLSRYHGFRLAVLTRVHTSVAVRWPRASPRWVWPSRGARSLALPDRAGGLAGRRLCLLGTVRPAHRLGPPVRPGAGLLASTGKNRKNGSGLGLGLWSGVAQTARGVGVLPAAESSDRRRVAAAAHPCGWGAQNGSYVFRWFRQTRDRSLHVQIAWNSSLRAQPCGGVVFSAYVPGRPPWSRPRVWVPVTGKQRPDRDA